MTCIRFAARLTDTAKPVKTWLGLVPSGTMIQFTEWCFYEFEESRIRSVRVRLDQASIRNQLLA